MKSESSPIQLDKTGLDKHYLSLTDSQQVFVQLVIDWCKRPRKILLVLSGGPGTGKSYVVKNTLKYIETEHLIMSYTGRSAQALGGNTIHSTLGLKTIDFMLKDEQSLTDMVRESRVLLNMFKYEKYPSIVVVDEVSMIDGWFIYWLIWFFMNRTDQPLLFITMGDSHQLKPFHCPYNLFSFKFTDELWENQRLTLTGNKRFKPQYAVLIDTLRTLVDAGDEEALYSFVCQHFPVVASIDHRFLAQAGRAMAAKNDRVKTFNEYYIKNMVQGPEIKIDDDLILKPGCLVIATSNLCHPAKNGTELMFQEYVNDSIICKDRATKQMIKIRRNKYNTFHIALGFATTIHKCQGDTIDSKIVIHFDGNKNLNMVYTALSRVREMDQILGIEF